jgi:hypothetical protein
MTRFEADGVEPPGLIPNGERLGAARATNMIPELGIEQVLPESGMETRTANA